MEYFDEWGLKDRSIAYRMRPCCLPLARNNRWGLRMGRLSGMRAICIRAVVGVVSASGWVLATHSGLAQTGLAIAESPYTVDETVARLEETVTDKGLAIFGKVDHAAGAAIVDEELPPTQVVMFGNPAVGTLLMQCMPTVAIDLPLKVLIWETDGQTRVAYNEMSFLEERHEIEGCDETISRITGALDEIVTEVTQPYRINR